MTAKEWLEVIQKSEDYKPEMTSLIIMYGKLLVGEASPKQDEQEQLWNELMQEWHDASTSNAKPNVLEYLKSKFTITRNPIK